MSPKSVYLDSSDYSCFASAAEDPDYPHRARWLALRERLAGLQASGKAIVRFSYPIVMEAYPKAPEHLPHALGRARAIMEIAGSNCLLDFRTLWAEEAISLVRHGSALQRAAAWSNDGAWHPPIDDFSRGALEGMMSENVQMLRKMLREETPLLRHDRRRLEKAWIRPNGTLTAAGASTFTREQRERFGDMVAEKLGLPRSPADDLFAAVLLGEVPPSAIGERVNAMFKDIRALFVQSAVQEHEAVLFHWIRSFGNMIAAPLRDARQEMMSLIHAVGVSAMRDATAPSRWEGWAPKLRMRILPALREAESDRFRAARVRHAAWEERVVASPIGSLPGLDAFLTAMHTHVVYALQASAQLRQPRDSDGGDIVHQIYLPYVDVFRCDGYAATVATQVVERLGLKAQVARSMEDALQALES